jgi:membrane protein YdbS with pleckstrin-like domain
MKTFWIFVAIGILGLLCVIGAFVIPALWSIALLIPGLVLIVFSLFVTPELYQSKKEREQHESTQALINWLRTPKE